MAHNARIRVDAPWTGVVLGTEAQQLDTYAYESINGDQGGTWAPAAAIIIGGLGMQVTGPLTVDDMQSSHVTSGNTLTVDSGGFIAVVSGGELRIATGGIATIESGGYLDIEGTIRHKSGGLLNLQSGSAVDAYGGSVVTFKTGSSLVQDAGATATLEGTSTLGGSAAGTFAVGSHGTMTFSLGNYPTMPGGYRWIPLRGYVQFQNYANWSHDGLGIVCSTASQTSLYYICEVPGWLTVTDIEVYWEGPAHGTWPPANLTTFNVWKVNGDTGGRTALDSTADTSSQPTYESAHSLTVATGLTTLLASNEFIVVEMQTESGTNAVQGAKWFKANVRVTFEDLAGLG